MANIEERVEQLERELTALKAQVSTIEEDLNTIPDLIKMEHRLTNTQFSRALKDLETRLLRELESLPSVASRKCLPTLRLVLRRHLRDKATLAY